MRLLLPFVPGGGADFVARVVTRKLTESLGQQIVLDYRPGGSGLIAPDIVAHAAPDGYTLYLAPTSFTVAPALQQKMPFDPLKDFAPITRLSITPGLLIVNPSVPAKTVSELVAYAKGHPGALSFGSAGVASASHMAGELFKLLAQVDILHVPYKGSSQVSTALIGGELSLAIVNPVSILPHIKAGRLRLLGVSTAKRSPLLPDVPTIAEAGVPGYENSIWTGIVAPRATPKPILARLHKELGVALRSPDVIERFATDSASPAFESPEEFAAYLKSDMEKVARTVKAAGIKTH